MQCGFCTPGMVMSCAALVERNPKCTLDDVKQAVSGHLCRCGTYPNVFKATLAAAKGGGKGKGEQLMQDVKDTTGTRAPATPPADRRNGKGPPAPAAAEPGAREAAGPPVWDCRRGTQGGYPPGAPRRAAAPAREREAQVHWQTGLAAGRRREGHRKARYTFDVQLPGMLWARRIVSPLPHARIKSIDTSAAERYPGVRAVHILERVLSSAQLRDPKRSRAIATPRSATRASPSRRWRPTPLAPPRPRRS